MSDDEKVSNIGGCSFCGSSHADDVIDYCLEIDHVSYQSINLRDGLIIFKLHAPVFGKEFYSNKQGKLIFRFDDRVRLV
jgi:hypothetical protein